MICNPVFVLSVAVKKARFICEDGTYCVAEKKKMGKVTTRRKISSAKSICFPDCSQTCTSDILTQLCSRVLKIEMSRGSGDLCSRFASRVREQFIIFAIGMVPSFGLCDSSSRMP